MSQNPDLPIIEPTFENVPLIMEVFKVDEQTARFMVAIELGLITGDIEVVNEEPPK